MKAPDFTLLDQNGKSHTLSQYLGKWVVLYFYPKDDTPGCTKEACNFRDSTKELQKLGVVILGVSKDSVASHKKFADKYKLNFTILSDPDKRVIQDYNAWGRKKFMGKEYDGVYRITYLINPKGKIEKKYEKVNTTTHADQVIADLKSMNL